MCLEINNNLLLVLQDAPKRIFSTNSRSSGQPKKKKKKTQRHFFSTLHPLSTVIFATATVLTFVLLRNSRFNFHCYTQRETTPTQKSARKCAATSCDLLRERLQSAFTLANRLRWIAQYVRPSDLQHCRCLIWRNSARCVPRYCKSLILSTYRSKARNVKTCLKYKTNKKGTCFTTGINVLNLYIVITVVVVVAAEAACSSSSSSSGGGRQF